MKDIKYRYIVSHPSKKTIHSLLFTLDQIQTMGRHPIFTRNYTILSRDLFTGIKDKNGVDIYESDIIKGLHCFGPAGASERIAQVSFHPIHGYQWSYWELDTLQVIGNIHKNPELLLS